MNFKSNKTIIYLSLFIAITGVSYFISLKIFPVNFHSGSSSAPTPSDSAVKKTGVLVFEGPKTEICPLNGQLFTKEEKTVWENRRPLLIMIENHADSRPQSGLSNADVVYEANSEGGITRLMGIFYCNAVGGVGSNYDVGPVRSARTYFLDLASEYADYPLYAHVGGSNCSAPIDPVTGRAAGPCTTSKKAQALEQIAEYGWQNKGTWSDLSQFSLSYKACRREEDRTGKTVATEHSMYCSSSELWNVAASRGLSNLTEIKKSSWNKSFRLWNFKQADLPSSDLSSSKATFDWWGDKAYSVTWAYDQSKKTYLRLNGGVPYVDFNTQEQLSAKNIIVQFTKETRSIDSHVHNLYAVVGGGEGVLLQNGAKTDITWSKPNRTARTIYKDKSGKEVNFVPGTIWIEILPLGNKINYEG
ncbi:MAG: DUF3048 domain-containing protein [Patescibacteria group bacterium]